MVKNIFNGKEKAWGSAVAMFLVSMILQNTTGEAIDPEVVSNVTELTTEVGVSAVAGGVQWFVTWLVANSNITGKTTS